MGPCKVPSKLPSYVCPAIVTPVLEPNDGASNWDALAEAKPDILIATEPLWASSLLGTTTLTSPSTPFKAQTFTFAVVVTLTGRSCPSDSVASFKQL